MELKSKSLLCLPGSTADHWYVYLELLDCSLSDCVISWLPYIPGCCWSCWTPACLTEPAADSPAVGWTGLQHSWSTPWKINIHYFCFTTWSHKSYLIFSVRMVGNLFVWTVLYCTLYNKNSNRSLGALALWVSSFWLLKVWCLITLLNLTSYKILGPTGIASFFTYFEDLTFNNFLLTYKIPRSIVVKGNSWSNESADL
jgi:hypothetical protein